MRKYKVSNANDCNVAIEATSQCEIKVVLLSVFLGCEKNLSHFTLEKNCVCLNYEEAY